MYNVMGSGIVQAASYMFSLSKTFNKNQIFFWGFDKTFQCSKLFIPSLNSSSFLVKRDDAVLQLGYTHTKENWTVEAMQCLCMHSKLEEQEA